MKDSIKDGGMTMRRKTDHDDERDADTFMVEISEIFDDIDREIEESQIKVDALRKEFDGIFLKSNYRYRKSYAFNSKKK